MNGSAIVLARFLPLSCLRTVRLPLMAAHAPYLERLVQPDLHRLSRVVVRHLPRRRRRRPLQQLEALVSLVVAQLHLHPLAPDGGKVVDLWR